MASAKQCQLKLEVDMILAVLQLIFSLVLPSLIAKIQKASAIFTSVLYRRFGVIVLFASGVAFLLLLQSQGSLGRTPQNLVEQFLSFGYLLYIPNFLMGMVGVMGFLSFRPALALEGVVAMPFAVTFRIVSRGENHQALNATIARCKAEMQSNPLFNYSIEVVIDGNRHFPHDDDPHINVIRVPDDYQTPRHTRFKARALHYAVMNSKRSDTTWTVYLDEETQPTASGVQGLCRMISEEEKSGQLRVGQGAILYGRTFLSSRFLTLADCIRTGDDFGRYYLQHRFGRPLFGLHGSWVVARNDIVKFSGGFDVGPNGHITEDAHWALVLVQKGIKTRWIDGYMEEQSALSISDFIRQRARWFTGIRLVAFNAPVKTQWRVPMLFLIMLWSLAPITIGYTFANIFMGFKPPTLARVPMIISYLYVLSAYLIGLWTNLKQRGGFQWFETFGWSVVIVLLTPIFGLIEMLGVLSAIFYPHRGFHVVKK